MLDFTREYTEGLWWKVLFSKAKVKITLEILYWKEILILIKGGRINKYLIKKRVKYIKIIVN